MGTLYQRDLAYIQPAAFAGLSQGAAPEIIRLLKCAFPVLIIGSADGQLLGQFVARLSTHFPFPPAVVTLKA
jgi:hypothetical protein